MCLGKMLLLWCTVIFAGSWRDAHTTSPVPSIPVEDVRALAGFCAVIPCSFTPPASKSTFPRHREVVDVRLRHWTRHFFPLWTTAFSTQDRSASQLGDTAKGDCSVLIDKVTLDDSRVYDLSLKGREEKDWGRGRSVNLIVSKSPDPPVISSTGAVTDGQVVSLNCSISYSCPSKAPTLQWQWETGTLDNYSQYREAPAPKPQDQSLTVWSSLTFTASHRIKSKVRCEAVYPGDKKSFVLMELHVSFPPEDVLVHIHTFTVQEGANALLSCSCKADPPVSQYKWSYTQHGLTVNLPERTHTVRVFNVTRDMTVRCTAQNLIGRAESKPTSLNIQYKPVILRVSSSCVIEGLVVLCRCSVDSNPRSAVTWSINESVPPYDYNTSVSSKNGTLTAQLRGHVHAPLTVVCFAINALGNDSQTLLHTEEGFLPWRVIHAAGISLVAFLFLLVVLFCCRRKRGKRGLTSRPSVYPEGMGIYQHRMPLYINCTEVTHIYTNGSYQLVYQNCTPCFVKTKQTRPIGRRGGERRGAERRGERGEERRGGESRGGMAVRELRDRQSPTTSDINTETAIYLEII